MSGSGSFMRMLKQRPPVTRRPAGELSAAEIASAAARSGAAETASHTFLF